MVLVLVCAAAALAGCGEKAKEAWAQLPDYSEAKQFAAALAVMLDPATYESTESMKAAWADVKDAYDFLVAAVEEKGDVATDKVTNLEEAFSSLEAAVSSLTSDMTPQEKINKIRAAVMECQDLVQQD
jgi:hypothetical protein